MKAIKIILFTTLFFSFITVNSNKVKGLEKKVKQTEQEESSYLEANKITANSFLSIFGDRKIE